MQPIGIPLAEFENPNHWYQVIGETFRIPDETPKGQIPIVSRVVDSNILKVGCRCPQAKPTWRLGFTISASLLTSPSLETSEFVAAASFFEQRITIGRLTFLHFPRYQPLPYLLTFDIPHWHQEIYLEGWKYLGPYTDSITEFLARLAEP